MPLRPAAMLPALMKLTCGIAHPYSKGMAGLQHLTIAAIGQELAQHQRGIQVGSSHWWPLTFPSPWQPATCEARCTGERCPSRQEEEEEAALVQQGQEALTKALAILEDKRGWKTEISEENGAVVYSKVLPEAKKVFCLEAELEASPEELHDILFVKVEEMNTWNPSVGGITVLRRINAETMVTHEVSSERAGNLIGQRDFLSVRHCRRVGSRIYLSGVATHLESLPPQSGFVRAEDGPTCIILEAVDSRTSRSRLTWLLNMDVKGWLPKSLVNQALPRAQADFTRYLQQHLAQGSVVPPRQERRRSVNAELGDNWHFGMASGIRAAL